MTETAKPRPTITPIDRPYWDYARAHELRLQRCGGCGTLRFPAAPICPECGERTHDWTRLSGRGEVISWVVFHRLYFPSFADELPYNVAMIRLAEGPVMISNIVEMENDGIRMGLPVEVVFEDVDDELTVPKFRPSETGGA